jgi:hypothetical protein
MVADATPGPWEVYDPSCGGAGIGVTQAGDLPDICAMADTYDKRRPADARLIAQAPTLAIDLADALEKIDRLREVIDSTANYLEEIGQGDGRACRWLRAALTPKEA